MIDSRGQYTESHCSFLYKPRYSEKVQKRTKQAARALCRCGKETILATEWSERNHLVLREKLREISGVRLLIP